MGRNVFISAGEGFTTLSAAKSLALERQGVCGNGWCEVGEAAAELRRAQQTWSMSTHSGVCLEDCPREPIACPATSVDAFQPTVACGGRGVCSSAMGACRCNVGYAGEDCSRCEFGFFRGDAGFCVPLPADIASATAPVTAVFDAVELSESGLPLWTIMVAVAAGLVVILVAVVVAVCLARRCDPAKGQVPTLRSTNTASNNPVAQRTTGSTRNEFHLIFAGVTPPEATLPVDAAAAAAARELHAELHPEALTNPTKTPPAHSYQPKPQHGQTASPSQREAVTVYASEDYVHRALASGGHHGPAEAYSSARRPLSPAEMPLGRRSSSPLRVTPQLDHLSIQPQTCPDLSPRRSCEGETPTRPSLAAAPVSVEDCPATPEQVDLSFSPTPSSPAAGGGLYFPAVGSRPGTADSVPDALAFALRDSMEERGIEAGELQAHHLAGHVGGHPSTEHGHHHVTASMTQDLEVVSHQLALEAGEQWEKSEAEASPAKEMKTCRF